VDDGHAQLAARLQIRGNVVNEHAALSWDAERFELNRAQPPRYGFPACI